jgi:holo-[acyl-carrier protein] synthase
MKTIGIGVDIIQNSRIKKSIKSKFFLERIYTKKEIKISKKNKNKVSFFSKRFAAKEAFVKALGTGFRNNLNFIDIAIYNDKSGKPKITLTKKLKKLINKIFNSKKINIFLSLSDEKNYSIAFVIIEKK